MGPAMLFKCQEDECHVIYEVTLKNWNLPLLKSNTNAVVKARQGSTLRRAASPSHKYNYITLCGTQAYFDT